MVPFFLMILYHLWIVLIFTNVLPQVQGQTEIMLVFYLSFFRIYPGILVEMLRKFLKIQIYRKYLIVSVLVMVIAIELTTTTSTTTVIMFKLT